MFDHMPIIVGSRDVGHAHFRGNFRDRQYGRLKIDVFSSSNFEHMFDDKSQILGGHVT